MSLPAECGTLWVSIPVHWWRGTGTPAEQSPRCFLNFALYKVASCRVTVEGDPAHASLRVGEVSLINLTDRNRNVRVSSSDIKSFELKAIHEKTGRQRILQSVLNNKIILQFIIITFQLSPMKSIRYMLS